MEVQGAAGKGETKLGSDKKGSRKEAAEYSVQRSDLASAMTNSLAAEKHWSEGV